MESPTDRTLADRVWLLEEWQSSVGPMLKQLSEDQAYRKRWMAERSTSRARWRRSVGWTITAFGGLVVAAASVVQLIHLL